MKHFIYKITHVSGLYYIGRHSTVNEDDGYMGSGAWVTGINDRSTLTKEILQYVDTIDELLVLEEQYITEHIDHDSNMNLLLSSSGFKPGVENFSDPELVRLKQRNARLGKSWEDIFGVERATELRIERSQPRGEMSEERKKNISTAKEGMIAPHDWTEESRAKLSKSMTGVVRSEEFKENQRKNVSVVVTCEHCGKVGSGIAMRRWHGKNCKHNPNKQTC
jgi:hypothetical protein